MEKIGPKEAKQRQMREAKVSAAVKAKSKSSAKRPRVVKRGRSRS